MLLAAALLLGSCAGQQNNGEKQLTARDIEGTWTVSDSSTKSESWQTSLDGFMVIAKPDDSAVLIFKDGKSPRNGKLRTERRPAISALMK